MTRITAEEIRRQFIEYFTERCGHTFAPSSPCVPHDDPTLLFTNAGMNQFKDVFLATGSRPYSRAVNSQKCIRAGGKQNDLDDVGKDTYHQTFFEMLGNWSFGDYFKKESIEWAWDLLTNVWGLDKTRLHATYFEGDDNVPADTEAAELWKEVTDINPDHIRPFPAKDNFWEMGDTGPCGPCSEIHIDLTPDKSGAHLVNADDPRVIEIWNLVFIQFNRSQDRKLTPLPAKHVDTGMGLERITAILQQVDGNYATDLFVPLFGAIQDVTGADPYTGKLEGPGVARDDYLRDFAYRVVADHIRCLTFALSDGAVPSNDGRGYVLRRILRRAVRSGWQFLGKKEPFLHRLVPNVVDQMGNTFPELKKSPDRIAEIIRDEEESFGKTLDRGIRLFAEAAERAESGRISGDDAFKLHDTFGFPIDLTEIMAEERKLTVDLPEYNRLMEEARVKAREGGKRDCAFDLNLGRTLPATDDGPKFDSLTIEAKLIGYVRDAKFVDSGEVPAGERVGLVLDRTCFYGEQGGQVGDSGRIGRFDVLDTLRHGDTVIHVGSISSDGLKVGDSVSVEVEAASRTQTMRNHTSTHILNWALREVLGDHVQQKGSLVDADKTRFDLSHPKQISVEELARIDDLVNGQIQDDLEVHTQVVDQAAARKINTLRAVFGEKYPDRVRVVSIGAPVDDLLANPDNNDWMKLSVEFCGGTHLARTGESRCFCLVEEGAVAKGIRRVTGITAERAEAAGKAASQIASRLDDAAELEGESLQTVVTEITASLNETELPVVSKLRLRSGLTELQARAKKLARAAAKEGVADVMAKVDEVLASALKVDGHSVIVANMGTATVDQLRAATDSLRERAGSAAVFLASENEGRVALLAAMTKDVVARGVKAGDVVKAIAPSVGGKGGGRPDMAQGGGTDVAKIDTAIGEAQEWLRSKLAN